MRIQCEYLKPNLWKLWFGHILKKMLRKFTLGNLSTLICTISTGLLSFDILADFLVRKPTSTSQKQINFDPSYFPSADTPQLMRMWHMHTVTSQPTTGKEELGTGMMEDLSGGKESSNGTQNFTNIIDRLLPVKTDTQLISGIWHLSKGVLMKEIPEI